MPDYDFDTVVSGHMSLFCTPENGGHDSFLADNLNAVAWSVFVD